MDLDIYISETYMQIRDAVPDVKLDITQTEIKDVRYTYRIFSTGDKVIFIECITYAKYPPKIVKIERLNTLGIQHCDWNFAGHEYDLYSAAVIEQKQDRQAYEWLHNGKPRQNGYARLIYLDSEVIGIEWKNLDGELHSHDDSPAQIQIVGDGKIHAIWCKHGKKHRDNKPACEIHSRPRTQFPSVRALVDYLYTNKPRYQEWWQDGKLHREDGKARREEYWLHGVCYPESLYKSLRMAAIRGVLKPLPIPIRDEIYWQFYIQ